MRFTYFATQVFMYVVSVLATLAILAGIVLVFTLLTNIV